MGNDQAYSQDKAGVLLAGLGTIIVVEAGTTEALNMAAITADEAVTRTVEAETMEDAMAGGTVMGIYLYLPAIAVGSLVTLLTGALLNSLQKLQKTNRSYDS